MVLRVVPPGGADLIVQSLGAGWYMPLSAIGACVGHELPIEPHLLALLAGDYPEAVVLDFDQPFRPRAAAALMSASLISSSAGVEAIRAGIMKAHYLTAFPARRALGRSVRRARA